MDAEQSKRIEAHRAADAAWEKAYDEARAEDFKAGRIYDRRIYAEKASAASRAALASMPHVHMEGRLCR